MKRIGCFELGLENIQYTVVPLLVGLWYGTSDHVDTGANPFGNVKEEGVEQGPQSPLKGILSMIQSLLLCFPLTVSMNLQ